MDALKKREIAIFAGGCFWCMESAFDKIDGILNTECGYTGGYLKNPTYEQVCYGHSGHYEAVKLIFDPKIVNYKELLKIYWLNIDPTDKKGQFCDIGEQYKTAIFYTNTKQKILAENSKKFIETSGIFREPIATKILPADTFYKAENYHQKYYKKCPVEYREYYNVSGRVSYKNIVNKLRKKFEAELNRVT